LNKRKKPKVANISIYSEITKRKIETELNNFCHDILNLLDSHLIKSAANSESKVFFLKMKGDYYRYIAEYAQGDNHKKAADGALDAYK